MKIYNVICSAAYEGCEWPIFSSADKVKAEQVCEALNDLSGKYENYDLQEITLDDECDFKATLARYIDKGCG